jgi:hypothetical protein
MIFISYSSHDEAFANRLHADLRAKNFDCWFAPHDLRIGDRFQERIEESILRSDKVMIVLSEASVRSRWVEREVIAVREREERENRIVLFPIRTDDAVMSATQPWAADIRRFRHIGDFRAWGDDSSYKKAFHRLVRDLTAGDGALFASWVEVSFWHGLTALSVGLVEHMDMEDLRPHLENWNHGAVEVGVLDLLSSVFVLDDKPLHVDFDPDCSWVSGTTGFDEFFAEFKYGLDRVIKCLPQRDKRIRHLIAKIYPNCIWVHFAGEKWNRPPISEITIDWPRLCAAMRKIASEFGLHCKRTEGRPIYQWREEVDVSEPLILITLRDL